MLCQGPSIFTVEPLYNGHIGIGGFVRYKEVSFIGRLVQECICNLIKYYYHVMKYMCTVDIEFQMSFSSVFSALEKNCVSVV